MASCRVARCRLKLVEAVRRNDALCDPGKFVRSHNVRAKSPNDRKLSDTPERRGACMVGGKAVVEAGAVTRRRVRCSAWLGASFIASEWVKFV